MSLKNFPAAAVSPIEVVRHASPMVTASAYLPNPPRSYSVIAIMSAVLSTPASNDPDTVAPTYISPT